MAKRKKRLEKGINLLKNR